MFLNCTLTLRKTVIEKHTEAYVDSLSENDRNRRDRSRIFSDQEKDLEKNRLLSLDSITVQKIF